MMSRAATAALGPLQPPDTPKNPATAFGALGTWTPNKLEATAQQLGLLLTHAEGREDRGAIVMGVDPAGTAAAADRRGQLRRPQSQPPTGR